jgi:hypothetical protein
MRFRTGFLIGAGAGYVLGTRAGRERYEQLRRWSRSVSGNPKVQQIAERGKEMAGEAAHKGADAVQHGVSKVGANVKERLGNGKSSDIDAQQIGI